MTNFRTYARGRDLVELSPGRKSDKGFNEIVIKMFYKLEGRMYEFSENFKKGQKI